MQKDPLSPKSWWLHKRELRTGIARLSEDYLKSLSPSQDRLNQVVESWINDKSAIYRESSRKFLDTESPTKEAEVESTVDHSTNYLANSSAPDFVAASVNGNEDVQHSGLSTVEQVSPDEAAYRLELANMRAASTEDEFKFHEDNNSTAALHGTLSKLVSSRDAAQHLLKVYMPDLAAKYNVKLMQAIHDLGLSGEGSKVWHILPAK